MLTYHFADVYLGRAAVQLPTDEVIAAPLRWLHALSEYGVTHSWSPNFGFKLVVAALREGGAPARAKQRPRTSGDARRAARGGDERRAGKIHGGQKSPRDDQQNSFT